MESQRTRLEGTESAADAIQRVRTRHDAIIDLIIAQPEITQGELAAAMGYTQAWVSRVINSDAFNEILVKRKQELIDPGILATIDERLNVVARKSLESLSKKLDLPHSMGDAIKVAELTTKSLGYGARQNTGVELNQQFVVALPPVHSTADTWNAEHAPKKPSPIAPTIETVVEEA